MRQSSRLATGFGAIALAVTLLTTGCAGPHSVGYAIDPIEGLPVKFKTPLLIRSFTDRRPASETTDPIEANNYLFWSCDKMFKENVGEAITRQFQFELANAGIEVAEDSNYLLGSKPHIRVLGDIYNFHVTRAALPVATMQNKVETLWRRDRFDVRVRIRITMIDTRGEKLVMQRIYTSTNSFDQRAGMIDVKAYEKDKNRNVGNAVWKVAGDDYCIQLLNEHLKRTMVQARQDIVAMLTPGVDVGKAPPVPNLTEPESDEQPEKQPDKPKDDAPLSIPDLLEIDAGK